MVKVARLRAQGRSCWSLDEKWRGRTTHLYSADPARVPWLWRIYWHRRRVPLCCFFNSVKEKKLLGNNTPSPAASDSPPVVGRCVGRMSATEQAAATVPAAATAAADVLSNPHLLAAILEQFARASDLAHATAVSTAWCQEACANALWRAHCLRSFPQLAGLLVAGADFRRLFIGQARSLHRPFRAPTPPELSPHGLRFLVHIEVRGS